MNSLFAGIHLQNKPKEYLLIDEVDFKKNIFYLKEKIAEKLQYDAKDIELIFEGNALEDDHEISEVVRPNGTVHCFRKTKKYKPYEASPDIKSAEMISSTQKLFNIISHIQISVNSRINILQKILAEYPEFRRNLGAQALIRDSVLFNSLHQADVIGNIAEQYPIICEAAPFIVDTIKKELTRNSSILNFSEPTTDSTTSSEEENSLGTSGNGGDYSSNRPRPSNSQQSENQRIRMISRQQLQAALAQISFETNNSLSNIAQRNTDANSATGESTERISSEMFRNQLQRALNSLNHRAGESIEGNTMANATDMDTSDVSTDTSMTIQDSSDTEGDTIPPYYRSHQYAEQLRTMAQMGFLNHEENLTYLNITNGNIENAVNLLMGAIN